MSAFVDLTAWIPVDEAKAMIKRLIDEGKYDKTQIKKSSNLFDNRKETSDGYICRVLAIAGIHPELEIKKEKKPSKKQAVNITTSVEELPTDNNRYVVTAEMITADVGAFLINRGNGFWLEHQNVKNNERKVVSPVVDNEEDAYFMWHTRRKYESYLTA